MNYDHKNLNVNAAWGRLVVKIIDMIKTLKLNIILLNVTNDSKKT